MQYLMLIIGYHSTEGTGQEAGAPSVDEFMSYDKAIHNAGVCIDANALSGTDVATTVRILSNGEQVVTDGPFAETREFVGGYYLIDVPDLDVALDWAARCPGAKYGRIEVRPVITF